MNGETRLTQWFNATVITRTLLRIGILVPFLYFGTDFVSSLFYPGYSHVRQYASELGVASAPHSQIFNAGMVMTGLAALLAAPGFVAALRKLRCHATLSWLTFATIICFGVAMLMAGFFPWPDRRHGGFN